MARKRNQHRNQTEARLDVIKVVIEEVNLEATPYELAQGREIYSGGIIDIDLTHGVGTYRYTPAVGEMWWVKRMTGRWILDHKVDADFLELPTGGGGIPPLVFSFAGRIYNRVGTLSAVVTQAATLNTIYTTASVNAPDGTLRVDIRINGVRITNPVNQNVGYHGFYVNDGLTTIDLTNYVDEDLNEYDLSQTLVVGDLVTYDILESLDCYDLVVTGALT